MIHECMEKTFIISDVHLGSGNCEAKALCDFLDHIQDRCDRLILNGDVFDSLDFRRLKKKHWHVLSLLRKISDKVETVWNCGNHDEPADIISHLLGIEVADEYSFESGLKKILVMHGHVFDEFLDNHPFLTWLSDIIYGFLQKIDNSHYIARLAKHSSKHYLRCSENIRIKATKYAEKKGFDVVCCGHSHNAAFDNSGVVWYANSGSWTERPCTYLEVVDGKIEVKEFQHL